MLRNTTRYLFDATEDQNEDNSNEPNYQTRQVVIKMSLDNSTTKNEFYAARKAYMTIEKYTLPVLYTDVVENVQVLVQPRYGVNMKTYFGEFGKGPRSPDSLGMKFTFPENQNSRRNSIFSVTSDFSFSEPASPNAVDAALALNSQKLLEIRYAFYQIIDALIYLQKANIYHLDIKGENILICPVSKKIKLIDFGFSRFTPVPKIMVVGTSRYCAPEIAQLNSTEENVSKHDVWSLGICLYRTVSGKFPYENLEEVVGPHCYGGTPCGKAKNLNINLQPENLKKFIKELDVTKVVDGVTIDSTKTLKIYNKVQYVLSQCLRVDPKERKTFVELLEEDLFLNEKEYLNMENK